ncbi:hypothetical protein [Burkholderia cenocepacia]|uniref:hypothetical protein n=1 Tax=Burkholderia cenocepacia TaxID=95486 RepID=UPI00285A8181|nr:hypothetical protein [Burkholderia cenocepacia]MDR8057716.1 hypothetical protein [Burkholderia cenocepacia]MDR8062192.1 hypothetical protein [Burkholderia cenocepacia]
MTITSLTIDQLEGEFAETEAEDFTLANNQKFYALVGELFPNTDPRVIHAVTLHVNVSGEGDREASHVRRVLHAMEDGFVNEEGFLSTFNEQYPATEDDLDDRAEWENTALVVKRETAESGDLYCSWNFEGSEL